MRIQYQKEKWRNESETNKKYDKGTTQFVHKKEVKVHMKYWITAKVDKTRSTIWYVHLALNVSHVCVLLCFPGNAHVASSFHNRVIILYKYNIAIILLNIAF